MTDLADGRVGIGDRVYRRRKLRLLILMMANNNEGLFIEESLSRDKKVLNDLIRNTSEKIVRLEERNVEIEKEESKRKRSEEQEEEEDDKIIPPAETPS